MKSVSRVSNNTLRRLVCGPVRAQTSANGVILRASAAPIFQGRNGSVTSPARCFHSSMSFKGIMPDAENPPPRQSEDIDQPTVPTDITTTEFHERADEYLDELVARLEEKQEETPDIEVEYSSGVLEVKIISKDLTYVLNKQPPNKQIWLSSPISGPKRFDWVVLGESMHQKEGGGSGNWIYLRDGTSLTDVVRKELGVELEKDGDVPS